MNRTIALNLNDRGLLIVCFIALRVLLLVAYQPVQVNGVERGVTAMGDFGHYYNLAELRTGGSLPYGDFWYEFPPIFAAVSLLVHILVGAGNFTAYASLLAAIMIGFDTLNLWLIMRITMRLHSSETGFAVGWLYTVLAAPLIIGFWTFEAFVTTSLLLGLLWFARRPAWAGAALVAGAFIKFYPVVLLGAAYRTLPVRRALIASGVVAVGIMLLIGFYLLFPRFGPASLSAQAGKASYQTVWALLDGNYRTGNFGGIADHFDPGKASVMIGNTPVIPFWLRTVIFGAIGLLIFLTARRRDEYGLVCFAALTILVFFLWSQGWSPQWIAVVIPLALITLPTRITATLLILLSTVVFVEYPFLFARTGDTNGVISGAQLPLFTALILIRTLLLILIATQLYAKLRFRREWTEIQSV